MNLEILRCLPWAEDLQDSLLRIFILDGRPLRSFVPRDHVLHGKNLSFTRVQGAGPWWARYIPRRIHTSSDIASDLEESLPPRAPRNENLACHRPSPALRLPYVNT